MRMRRLMLNVTGGGLLTAAAFFGIFLTAGCESYGAMAVAGADSVSVTLEPQFGGGRADLFLYRITSRKTGAYLGVGRSFPMRVRGQARAVLTLHDVPPGTPLLVHTMWINPDGKEVYTKENHIRREDWNDADLIAALNDDHITLDPQQRLVKFESRYGISPDRLDEQLHKPEEHWTFKTGTWTVRTYLFRKKLLETTFELLPPE